MERIKKALLIFSVLLYGVGVLGGFALSCNAKEPFVAICVIVLGVFGFPTVKRIFERLSQ